MYAFEVALCWMQGWAGGRRRTSAHATARARRVHHRGRGVMGRTALTTRRRRADGTQTRT
eukprot:627296-Prymnesium_polylepis.1